MSNVRQEIEYEYGRNGVRLAHPSGVEVFESKEQVLQHQAAIDDEIIDLQVQRAAMQRDVLDHIDTADGDVDTRRVR